MLKNGFFKLLTAGALTSAVWDETANIALPHQIKEN